MKEALKNDRARIQVGRISSFGLMEMSRQRLRTGVLEASTKPCPHCEGTGLMRTASSAGLSALRMIEDEAARGRGEQDPASRRPRSRDLRAQQQARRARRDRSAATACRSRSLIDESFEGARMSVESSGPRRPRPQRRARARRRSKRISRRSKRLLGDDAEEDEDEEDEEERRARGDAGRTTTAGPRRRRRRRGGRGRGRREGGEAPAPKPIRAGEEPAGGRGRGRQPSGRAEDEAAPTAIASAGAVGGKRADAAADEPAPKRTSVEPDSSPMVERAGRGASQPIAEVGSPAEPQPKPRRTGARRRRPKQRPRQSQRRARTEPRRRRAETAEEPKPAKPRRKSRAKKAKDEAGGRSRGRRGRPSRPRTMTRRTTTARRRAAAGGSARSAEAGGLGRAFIAAFSRGDGKGGDDARRLPASCGC